jgi:hypothetical protein
MPSGSASSHLQVEQQDRSHGALRRVGTDEMCFSGPTTTDQGHKVCAHTERFGRRSTCAAEPDRSVMSL